MEFRPYMHVEKFGNDEVDGIELGRCYVFPKIDGTNASVWHCDGKMCCGSRKRELSLDADNQGFMDAATNNDNLMRLVFDNKRLRFYGEWLVPHTLRVYRDDAWRQFYVFDVYCDDEHRYLHYDEYKPLLESYGVEYIPPQAIVENADHGKFLQELDRNTFLIDDGNGFGEGVVIKNYDYRNRFGRTVWAKIVRNEFKERNQRTMGAPEKIFSKNVESRIAEMCVTRPLIDKVYAKIVNDRGSWNSTCIGQLLGTVYHDVVTEELWNAIKKLKSPTVNFGTLNKVCTQKVKELLPEVF